MAKALKKETPKPKRREVILQTAHRMFNELGVDGVSTTMIAHEMGISPGNLHYHFRNRQEIVFELFLRLETATDPVLDILPDEQPDSARVMEEVQTVAALILEYQFLFPEVLAAAHRDERFAQRYAVFQNRIVRRIAFAFGSSYVAGELAREKHPAYIAALGRNLWLLLVNWGAYLKIASGDPKSPPDPASMMALLFQIYVMMEPYLSDDARADIQKLFPMTDPVLDAVNARFQGYPSHMGAFKD